MDQQALTRVASQLESQGRYEDAAAVRDAARGIVLPRKSRGKIDLALRLLGESDLSKRQMAAVKTIVKTFQAVQDEHWRGIDLEKMEERGR